MKRCSPRVVAGGLVAAFGMVLPIGVASQGTITEAPTGFDNITNGFVTQARFDRGMAEFEERYEIKTGLGPVYNAQSCGECHQSPVSGGISQITELFAGRLDEQGMFVDAPGGSLIQDRAIDASIVESVPPGHDIRAFRTSLNVIGDGFVESIEDETLMAIADEQNAQTGGAIRGQIINVPVVEANGALRAGRFGWKDQHASLVSFSADAYLNEMGITSPLIPEENSSNGRSVAEFDQAADPEIDGGPIQRVATFLRATKAPPRDEVLAATPDAMVGEQIFRQIGCAICHRPSIRTAAPGTLINGDTFRVPPALGNKVIHPFSDFLLHDIGTGDGIVQNGGQGTRNKLRTAWLWGLRTRSRLMHDGLSFTFTEAIQRHQGEAASVTQQFQMLSPMQQSQLLTFLKSL